MGRILILVQCKISSQDGIIFIYERWFSAFGENLENWRFFMTCANRRHLVPGESGDGDELESGDRSRRRSLNEEVKELLKFVFENTDVLRKSEHY
jgi:hypothetical protein